MPKNDRAMTCRSQIVQCTPARATGLGHAPHRLVLGVTRRKGVDGAKPVYSANHMNAAALVMQNRLLRVNQRANQCANQSGPASHLKCLNGVDRRQNAFGNTSLRFDASGCVPPHLQSFIQKRGFQP
jgi:hypothetical protein